MHVVLAYIIYVYVYYYYYVSSAAYLVSNLITVNAAGRFRSHHPTDEMCVYIYTYKRTRHGGPISVRMFCILLTDNIAVADGAKDGDE